MVFIWYLYGIYIGGKAEKLRMCLNTISGYLTQVQESERNKSEYICIFHIFFVHLHRDKNQ